MMRQLQFAVTSPATGEVLAHYDEFDLSRIDDLIRLASLGQAKMADLSARDRALSFEKAIAALGGRQTEFVDVIHRESGKTKHQALAEFMRTIETLSLCARESLNIYGESIPLDVCKSEVRGVGFTQKFPAGIVLAITPFSTPLNSVAHKVGAALAAGNSVILKPSPLSPTAGLWLMEALKESGFPDDAIKVTLGTSWELLEKLVSHPLIRVITFTGSPNTAQRLLRHSGMKKWILELGNSTSVSVFADAKNLESIAQQICAGALTQGGQRCVSIQRVYIEEAIFEKLKNYLSIELEKYSFSEAAPPQYQLGPVISESSASRIEGLIKDAQQTGAEVLRYKSTEGLFVAPAMLCRPPKDHAILKEELFGPAFSICGFEDEREAIQLVNNSPFGLQHGVYTSDLSRTLRLSKALRAGSLYFNASPTQRFEHAPFGGVGMSGIGREGIKYEIAEMLETRFLVFNVNEIN